MGFPAQLVSRDSGCRQQWQCGRVERSFLLVRRLGGAQDICAITVFGSPWPIHPSVSVLFSSRIRGSGPVRCSSLSSVWQRSPSNSDASGEAQPVEELWKEYFADPTQWWDNRADKRDPRSPDFRHKVTRKALWVYGWSTPPWVKARLNLAGDGRTHTRVDHRSKNPEDTTPGDRLSKGHKRERSMVAITARESRHIVQGGGGGMSVKSARSTTEAIGNLKKRVEEGMAMDSYMYVEVLRLCLKEENLDVSAVKQVHDYIKQSGMEQNRYVANNLMSVYIRCGELQDARGVFDKLVNKNVFSWTIMIGGFAKHNHAERAMELFKQMCENGIQPDAVTFSSILKACANPSALEWGKEVHAYVRHAGLESDVRMGNTLVHMYASCGSIDDARVVFKRMEERDVISWNVMIGGLAEHGFGQDAYELLLEMQREGCVPDATTYVSILNPRSIGGTLEWVKEVHRHVLRAGLESDLRVGTALVQMYGKSGSVDDARLVFDSMKDHDVVTWNVMIGTLAEQGCGPEAYERFVQMHQAGIKADAITYLSILNPCASAGALEWVKEVHRHVLKSGVESDLRVGNALVHMFGKIGKVEDARSVFVRMEDRDVITWNVMIGGLAENDCLRDAYEMLLLMKVEGFKPDAITYLSILNPCGSAGALEWVKEVHRHVTEAGLDSDLRVCTALVRIYASIGRVDDARLVFDRMEDRNLIIWNVMIGGLADHGCGHEAYELLIEMQEEGFIPDAITYLSILNPCASGGASDWVMEVHRHVLEAGLESDFRVGTALVRMYASCGRVVHARLVFDRMEARSVITWNVMIGGLVGLGCGYEAYELFMKMLEEGIIPDAFTYTSILNPRASTGALEWVKEVHKHVLKAGLESDLRVGNALIHMYGKCGSVDDARLVFDRMEDHDLITWNVMIGALAEHGCGREAYELFLQMEQDGLEPNAITYASILNPGSSAGALEWVKEIRRRILDAGLESDLRVGNALVQFCGKCGIVDDARLVFDRMADRNVITWNVMIGALAEHGFGHEAYEMFMQMQQDGFKPDAVTYTSILNPCSSAGALEWVKEVHEHVLKAGLASDLRVGKALVHMYAKSGRVDDARVVFEGMEDRDVITWNVMIAGLAQHGCGSETYRLLLQMKQEGLEPNAITYTSILNPCSCEGELEWVKEVHRHVIKAGLESDLRVGNALVHVYGKSGSIDNARLVFERMEDRDVITWTVMIGALAEHGCGSEAYALLLQMKQKGLELNAITYTSILNPCSCAGALEWVKDVHRHVIKAGLESDLRVGNALVRMYSKCGSLDDAQLVFDRIKGRDVITWTVMIGGLADHGLGHEALDVFNNMIADGVKPNQISFVAVLTACSHAGLVDEGRRLYLAMTREYGIEPSVVLCTCMVDILGRAGHLEEAKAFVGDMPVEPDRATWAALLGACRTYGNVELGKLAAKELLKLDPKDASAYVLLSNICAAAGKWEEVFWVRSMMQERGVRKEPGRSWIEVDNKVHDFVVGDTSHPEATEIYSVLGRLSERIKGEGYIPDTRLVLRNIGEEEKEVALCSHSEKLAIAYGLMRTPPGEAIRVFKNLRVCSDCHTATKFISKATEREIVVRDANRFHHFRDGECSCGDYW